MRRIEEKLREDRIETEIMLDCYTSSDQMHAWYNHFQGNISFPFNAIWRPIKYDIEAEVKVIEMPDFIFCKEERDMIVDIDYDGEIQSVSLFEIFKPDADLKTKEAIEDWHYWVNCGNKFDDEEGYY